MSVNIEEAIARQKGLIKRFHGANVKFLMAYKDDEEASLKAGRLISEQIPSISIQWPGMDETVRKIEEQDKLDYPEEYARFAAGELDLEVPLKGTPLKEWSMMPASVVREMAYLGIYTIEQLSDAKDNATKKLGPLGKWQKTAKTYLAGAAEDPQAKIVGLQEQLNKLQKALKKKDEQIALLMQRIDANEGTDFAKGFDLDESTDGSH